MADLKKLVAVGSVLTLLGGTGAYYSSNATIIQDKVGTLFDLANQYKTLAGQNQQTAEEKQAILDSLAELLGATGTDLESLQLALSNKLAGQTTATTQEVINTIAGKLGLSGKTDYTMDDVTAEITHLQSNDTELKDVLNYLEITDWDGTSESIETAIINKVNKAVADNEQALMNEIAWDFLGMAKTDDDGNTINYTKAQVINEIVSVTDEIKAVEQYIDDYNAYNNPNMDKYYDYNEDGKITLLEKIQSMIDQLNQAQADSEANLKLVEQKIINLGHCPVHETALDGNYCKTCDKNYTKTTEGTSSSEGDKGITGGTTGTTTGGTTSGTTQTVNADKIAKTIADTVKANVTDVTQVKVEVSNGGGNFEGLKCVKIDNSSSNGAKGGAIVPKVKTALESLGMTYIDKGTVNTVGKGQFTVSISDKTYSYVYFNVDEGMTQELINQYLNN
jgi:hypothetical protein